MNDKLYRAALQLYFKCEKIPLLSTVNLAGYRFLANRTNPHAKRMRIPRNLEPIPPAEKAVDSLRELRLAMIADTMTFSCFSSVCDCIALTCDNWYHQLQEFRPHIFFCESAWLGNEKDGFCWRGQIYQNKTVWFENRKTVLQILAYCQQNGIPTLFYNKEDPTSFDDPYHNFGDLALKFDYIYTTAAECVDRYKARGAKFCRLLQMGVSLKLYNPLRREGQQGKGAVFAGSWYAEHKQRCAEMEALFDEVLQAGEDLAIYDRYSGESNPQKQFPPKYAPYLHPAVPFEQLGELLKNYKYALNINTVQGSKTMFARRVFEVMALGLYVISNRSEGLQELFGEKISFTGEGLPDEARYRKAVSENLAYVMQNHSYEQRLLQICADLGIAVRRAQPVICCVDAGGDLPPADYYYFGQADEALLAQAAVHFRYLPQGVGAYLSHARQPFVIWHEAGASPEGMLVDAEWYLQHGVPEDLVNLGVEDTFVS